MNVSIGLYAQRKVFLGEEFQSGILPSENLGDSRLCVLGVGLVAELSGPVLLSDSLHVACVLSPLLPPLEG